MQTIIMNGLRVEAEGGSETLGGRGGVGWGVAREIIIGSRGAGRVRGRVCAPRHYREWLPFSPADDFYRLTVILGYFHRISISFPNWCCGLRSLFTCRVGFLGKRSILRNNNFLFFLHRFKLTFLSELDDFPRDTRPRIPVVSRSSVVACPSFSSRRGQPSISNPSTTKDDHAFHPMPKHILPPRTETSHRPPRHTEPPLPIPASPRVGLRP